MATCSDNELNSKLKYYLDKDKLEAYWTGLKERVKTNIKREIMYICHCTCIKARRGIVIDGVIKGGDTDLPSTAPLASNTELQGTWFSLSDDILPRKSPYGTQRMVFTARELMSYLIESTEKGSREPRLFFECAHCYCGKQYVRFLLVRTSTPDHLLQWCEKSCKEINLQNNPFFEYRYGRIWSRAHKIITIDVLIVGDIHLQDMQPRWEKIRKSNRAVRDPVIGLL